MLAIALFKLKDHLTKSQYEQWALENIRPKMLLIDSVIKFSDYTMLEGNDLGYDFVEVIEITDKDSFESDNSKGIGLEIANEWEKWVEKFTILYGLDYEP